jgi:uroporphyrinogen decarboxylase
MITHRDRLESSLSLTPTDRTPVALWRHFPVDDQTPEGLAAATLSFQKTFDFDFVKVTPESSFCLKDWGAKDEWRGATEGTRTYTHRVIQHPDDWTKLPVLDPKSGNLGRQLQCLQLLVKELGEDTPIIQTIFNPLSQAKNLVGNDRLLVHLRRYPEAVHDGLKIITESTQRFIDAAADTGIAGIFFAVQHAQYGVLTSAEYETFGKSYDLQVLEPAHNMWFNMLHLHGSDIMFDKFTSYPVHVINWHDQETAPSLSKGLENFHGLVCGGIKREATMVLGTPQEVMQEAREAILATEGTRFILGTGCVTPTNAPYGNILAARNSVDQF